MDDRLVTIYRRADGRLFLHRHNRTTMGVSLACPPFIAVAPEEIEEVHEAVTGLLASPSDTVPHPRSFDQLNELFELAGCRNWKQFTKGASCLHVQQIETDILIIPTERDGTGFRHLRENAIRFEKTALKNRLLEVLKLLVIPDSDNSGNQ